MFLVCRSSTWSCCWPNYEHVKWVGVLRPDPAGAQAPGAWSPPQAKPPGQGQSHWEWRWGSRRRHLGKNQHTGKHFKGNVPPDRDVCVCSFYIHQKKNIWTVIKLSSTGRTPAETCLKWTKCWDSTGIIRMIKLRPWHWSDLIFTNYVMYTPRVQMIWYLFIFHCIYCNVLMLYLFQMQAVLEQKTTLRLSSYIDNLILI